MNKFTNILENKANIKHKMRVKKIYINEDPNLETPIPCPKCVAENKPNVVRYMYVNMNEAICKCEGASCMYPFRDFKFKNYSDNTVYYYKQEDHSQHPPPQAKSGRDCQLNTSFVDFNIDLLASPDKNLEEIFDDKNSLNIFNDRNSSTKEEFDTRFIDDLFNDLGEPKVATEKVKLEPKVVERKLKKCLQMFQETKIETSSRDIFKIPPPPGSSNFSDAISPCKLKSKKHKKHKRKVKQKPQNLDTLISKSHRMKPMDVIESLSQLDIVRLKPHEQTVPKIFKSRKTEECRKDVATAERVQKMLSFIERSIKVSTKSPESSLKSNDVKKRIKEKIERISNSQKVLKQDECEYEKLDFQEIKVKQEKNIPNQSLPVLFTGEDHPTVPKLKIKIEKNGFKVEKVEDDIK